MKLKTETSDVGVIIGRFQIHELHAAHCDLIKTVCDRHQKVVIFLGLNAVGPTKNNPLDFECRKQMILEKFPDVIVLYIKDDPSDVQWSINLDFAIKDMLSPSQTAIIYGSRDSFISRYYGGFQTQELISEIQVSATEIRNSVKSKAINSPEFRAGVIWAKYNEYPIVYTTVDIAILNKRNQVLLVKKPNEKLYRFLGGFSSGSCVTFEDDIIRETFEEAAIIILPPKYVGSYIIDDWRYKSESNRIKTIFFISHITGKLKAVANDDIESVKWVSVSKLRKNIFEPCHRVLLDMFFNYVNTNYGWTVPHGT